MHILHMIIKLILGSSSERARRAEAAKIGVNARDNSNVNKEHDNSEVDVLENICVFLGSSLVELREHFEWSIAGLINRSKFVAAAIQISGMMIVVLV